MKAEFHEAEEARLAALRSFDILDTPREEDFDEVVRVAADICEAPISVINLIDQGRQWFKAEVGLGVRETPLDSSLCAHAILQPGLFIVPDTTLDERFADNALVVGSPRLRFYAGALLRTPDGLPLGTVCVLDYKPRGLDDRQKAFLKMAANQVMKLIELRKTNATERAARIRAEDLARINETLVREGDHRVMNSLQLVQSMLVLQGRNATSDEAKDQLKTAANRVLAIAMVHRQLHLSGDLDHVDIDVFLRKLCENLKHTAPPEVSTVNLTAASGKLSSDTTSGIGLLVAEFVTNSFKYAYPAGQRGSVNVDFSRTPKGWRLEVSDEGRGLPAGFEMEGSTGFGMQVVKAFVQRLGAHLTVSSRPGYTAFRIEGSSS